MNWIRARRYAVTIVTTIAGPLSIAACGNGTDLAGSGANQMRISFTTQSPSSSLRGNVGLANDIAIGPAGQLVIKKIQLVLNRVELSRAGAETCTDDNERGNGDCEEIEGNALLVNVPVDDALHTIITVPVAAGTYRRLEARLGPVDAGTGATLGVPTDMAAKSIRVEGTFNGTPFVYTSPLRTGFEFEFNPPLVVDGTSTKNATVNIDVRKWFLTSGGVVVDPATANAGGINAQLVENNIRSSVRAFEDDDMGGDDDNAEQEGGSDGNGGGHDGHDG